VEYYGRDSIEAFASSPDAVQSLSLPFILFIVDFGMHRNMYRALKGFYFTPACLDYQERRKTFNEFTLTLGPHGAVYWDIIDKLEEGIGALGKDTLVKAFPISLTGDMPQAADNSGFMRHNAVRGCRACYCTQDVPYDLHLLPKHRILQGESCKRPIVSSPLFGKGFGNVVAG
jgi:hypothetical protein